MSPELQLDPTIKAFKAWIHAEAQSQTVSATSEMLRLKADLAREETDRERSTRIERWVLAGVSASLLGALTLVHALAATSPSPAIFGGLGLAIPICAAAGLLALSTAWLLES